MTIAEEYLLKKEKERVNKNKKILLVMNIIFKSIVFTLVMTFGFCYNPSFKEILTFVLGFLFAYVNISNVKK